MPFSRHISRHTQESNGGKVWLNNNVLRVGINLWSGATIFHISQVEPNDELVAKENPFAIAKYFERKNILNDSTINGIAVSGGNARAIMATYGIQPAINMGFFGFGNGHQSLAEGGGQMNDNWRIIDETLLTTTIKAPCCSDLFVTQNVKLVHDTVAVNYSIAYSGKQNNDKKPVLQRMPPSYFSSDFNVLVGYSGDMPWHNEATDKFQISQEKQELLLPERWIALMRGDDTENCTGMYFPHTSTIEVQRAQFGATYVAPTRLLPVEPGMKLNFNIFLCVGSIGHIRSVFSILRNSLLDSSVTYREILQASEHLSSDAKGAYANAIRNGQLRLVMQPDGNIVFYEGDDAVWSAQTWDMGESHGPYRLEMQRDGNLVAYAGDKTPYWHTDTAGAYGAYLVVYKRQDSKTPVAEVRVGRSVKWSTERLMRANDVLEQNTYIEHKKLFLTMQTDGNVVLYKDKIEEGKGAWSSKTFGMEGRGPFTLKMQEDGNLVAYKGDNKPYWSTKTDDKPGAHVFFYEAYDPKSKKNVGQMEVRRDDEVLWEAVDIPEEEMEIKD